MSEDNRRKLLKKIINNNSIPLWDGNVYIIEKFLGDYEENSYSWNRFKDEIKINNRFFPTEKVTIDLKHLEFLLQNIELKIKKEKSLFRARISNDALIEVKDMYMPPPNKTLNGRANPVGIPYLYLSDDIFTACSELKPTIKDIITTGEFIILDDITIIDLRYISPFQFTLADNFGSIVQDINYLNGLAIDLSCPVNPKKADVEYIPAQYLCEFIKNRGWDGVIYKSSFGKGSNIALFSTKNIKCISTKRLEVKTVNWGFSYF